MLKPVQHRDLTAGSPALTHLSDSSGKILRLLKRIIMVLHYNLPHRFPAALYPVSKLQEAVRELSDALNGNADDQTVTGLVEQVQELAARVNEIEDTSLAELEKQLTEGLADLRAAYESADDALEASLANKAEADAVTTLQGQMTTVQGDLQGALADLATLKADGDATALLNKINNLVSQYEDLSNKLA